MFHDFNLLIMKYIAPYNQRDIQHNNNNSQLNTLHIQTSVFKLISLKMRMLGLRVKALTVVFFKVVSQSAVFHCEVVLMCRSIMVVFV